MTRIGRSITLAMLGALAANGSQVAARAGQAPAITMYATADCGYCAKARAYFSEHRLAFEERDIGASAQAAAEWRANGGVGTPLILIGDEKINGFDAERIERALAKQVGHGT